MKKINLNIDPYRVLFPLGLLGAIAGLLIWILFRESIINYYPRDVHANLMFFGFLWSFVAGFLMTAVPKMTNTSSANIQDILIVSLLVILQTVLSVTQKFQASVILFLIQISYLIFFITKRFLDKKQIPFEGFFFVPFAFVQSILGVVVFLFSNGVNYSTLYLLSGEAFILNLILGIGSRLIPVLSRIPNALTPDIQSKQSKKLIYLLLAIVLNLGFVIQAFFHQNIGIIIKLIPILYVSINHFKLFSKGTTLSAVGVGLKTGILFIIVSQIGALFSLNPIANQHLLYVGGFFLITLMIGTRVMLAHGGESLNKEVKSPKIMSVIVLLVIAAGLRFHMGSDISSSYLIYAAYAALLAVLIWGYKFVRILLKVQ
jgi:uncharacterized protein involved in response to NO